MVFDIDYKLGDILMTDTGVMCVDIIKIVPSISGYGIIYIDKNISKEVCGSEVKYRLVKEQK